MHRFAARTAAIVFAALLLARCSDVVGPDASPPRVLTPQEQRLVASDNLFGLKLFRALNEDAAGKNVFFSPLSISMALGMTLNGAAGETRSAMEATLEQAGLSPDEINRAYQGLIALLQALDPEVTFELANAIWYREGFSAEQPFLDVNRTYFDAEVAALDFTSPAALGTINGWVDAKTHGKIEKIIDGIPPEAVMYLLNAIYFKGTWRYEFDEADTHADRFTRPDGSDVDVQMMRQETDLPYLATETFQAVDLPYGDSLYSMTVLLPHPGQDVDALVASLTQERWDQWTAQLGPHGVALELPRFQLAYEATLNDVLSALGMGIAFDPMRADFSGINPLEQLYISLVKHKAFVEVNEEGTEAAAVTVVAIETTSVGGGSPIPVRVDRPFVFVIRENHSGTLLFVGKVTDPTA